MSLVQRLAAGPYWHSAVEVFDRLVQPGRRNVHLAFSCTHFGKVYALNHFLVVLLGRYLEERSGTSPIVPGFRLRAVHPVTPHACGNAVSVTAKTTRSPSCLARL